MSESVVLYELRPPAAIVTLNRPDRRNAISRALVAGVTDAFHRARDEEAARCVILTGAGSSFCAGMDLAELSESIERKTDANNVWNDALNLATVYDLIYTLPKPTIAAVNGAAVAGGAGFVTVCDLAVAVPEA
ncbi:MAG TPA: enoyl-CoA hydratase/isomerase family protein, partial [Gemmataceae bacterium]|nr:enoyl-CoA hydratase/isomerase family protein [Gemmataceae bacterium]